MGKLNLVSLIHHLGDMLTTDVGRKRLPVWAYVVCVVSIGVSVVRLRRLKAAKVNADRAMNQVLDSGGALAAFVSRVLDSGDVQTRKATLRRDGQGRYALTVTTSVAGLASESARSLDGLAAVAAYLDRNTVLRLRDFKPVVS